MTATVEPIALPVTAPVDVVAKLSTTLAIHHAPHLLSGVLACLAPFLAPRPSEGGRRAIDAVAVVGLVSLLTSSGRPDLITRVLLAVTPWLPAAPAVTSIPPAPPPSMGLSVRQTEILHWVSYGLTYGDIGRRLGLAEATIKTHARAIHRALGARDRADAVRLGFKHRVLNSD